MAADIIIEGLVLVEGEALTLQIVALVAIVIGVLHRTWVSWYKKHQDAPNLKFNPMFLSSAILSAILTFLLFLNNTPSFASGKGVLVFILGAYVFGYFTNSGVNELAKKLKGK
ncbi:MAG: hypothetical protein KAX49_16615 [Halanaerobiales bacterium]|nr:hypothetical protein [Halanaerobiales bacterium]